MEAERELTVAELRPEPIELSETLEAMLEASEAESLALPWEAEDRLEWRVERELSPLADCEGGAADESVEAMAEEMEAES